MLSSDHSLAVIIEAHLNEDLAVESLIRVANTRYNRLSVAARTIWYRSFSVRWAYFSSSSLCRVLVGAELCLKEAKPQDSVLARESRVFVLLVD